MILPLVRLWYVPVELEALRVGEGALILDRLTHQNLLHGDLHLFEMGVIYSMTSNHDWDKKGYLKSSNSKGCWLNMVQCTIKVGCHEMVRGISGLFINQVHTMRG